MSMQRLLGGLGLLASLAMAACGGGDSGGDPVGPPADAVARVTITDPSGPTLTLEIGQSRNLAAQATNAAGAPIATAAITWSGSNDAIATVDRFGILRAVAAGSARIIASSATKADTLDVTVKEKAVPPPMVEARALWVNRFEYDSEAKIATIMQQAAAANFNIVYFQVRGAGDAYYVSTLEPCAVSVCGRLGGANMLYDPLAVALREAKARGLQLHAWVNAFSGWANSSTTSCDLLVESAAGKPRHMLLAHPEWRVLNSAKAAQACPGSSSDEYIYVSPGVPEARTHLARVAAEIARNYAVDGIHLDRIRYPGTSWSYDSASLANFGRDPATNASDWANFRRMQVDLAVKEIYDSLRVARPSAVLSAAVWGIYRDTWSWGSSQGWSQYFQDPPAWAAGGYLDVSVPMTYWNIEATMCAFADWACLLDDHLARIQTATGKALYIGISAAASNGGAAEVQKQILRAREKGAKGVSVYSYNAALAADLFNILPQNVFAGKATVPAVAGKN